ncbi:MAG: amino acid ABC transporter permease [Lactobacillales bacterium]|jgi:polar amino acid transport system permease protein|nr:amino acid ABC transporter permease [Lactobacillales bacterium]
MRNSGIEAILNADNFERIFYGLAVTMKIALISLIFSIVFGVLLGLVMTVKNRIIRFLTKMYVEFNRIMPQLVTLFLVYFGLSHTFGLNFSAETSAIIVFTMWGVAEIGELVRSLTTSVPKIQHESAEALGLTKKQTFGYIILPQIFKPLLPGVINLATRMIKTTSLVVLIGVVEILKTSQQIIEANRYTAPDAALWLYGFVFMLYFLVCWSISLIAKRLEFKFKN